MCHVGNREILTVNAALGHRPFPQAGQWEELPPDLPRPEECPPRPQRIPVEGTIARASTSGSSKVVTWTSSTARSATDGS